jgi:fluoride exporter
MLPALAVAIGGGGGALPRYGLDRLIEHNAFSVFPWSTFAINVTGCFVAGVTVAALVDRHHLPGWVRAGIVVGFLGGYTTFSTFGQETRDLLVEGHSLLAVTNVVVSCGVGVAVVVAGAAVGRGL